MPVLNEDIILSHRHRILTCISPVVAGRAYKSRIKEFSSIRSTMRGQNWADKNLLDVVDHSSNGVVQTSFISIVWISPTLSPPTLVLTYLTLKKVLGSMPVWTTLYLCDGKEEFVYRVKTNTTEGMAGLRSRIQDHGMQGNLRARCRTLLQEEQPSPY